MADEPRDLTGQALRGCFRNTLINQTFIEYLRDSRFRLRWEEEDFFFFAIPIYSMV